MAAPGHCSPLYGNGAAQTLDRLGRSSASRARVSRLGYRLFIKTYLSIGRPTRTLCEACGKLVDEQVIWGRHETGVPEHEMKDVNGASV